MCDSLRGLCRSAETVPVAEEHHSLVLASSTFVGRHPLTVPEVGVHALEEAEGTTTAVTTVVTTHDRLDGFCGFCGVIERNGADVVVENVSLNDVVEKVGTDGPEVAVDSCSSATSVGPRFVGVVRKRRVGVLKERDGDCGKD